VSSRRRAIGGREAQSLVQVGQSDDVEHVGHDLAEGIGVGDQPAVGPGHGDDVRAAEGEAHRLERVLGDDLVAPAPQDHDRQATPTEFVEFDGEVGATRHSGRPPEGPGIAQQVGQGLGHDDREDLPCLPDREDIGRQVDPPVPQGALGHGADRRPLVGPGRATDRVDQHERPGPFRVLVREADGHAAAEGVPHDQRRLVDADLVEEQLHPPDEPVQIGGAPGQGGGPAEPGERGGDHVDAGGDQAGQGSLVGLVVESPAVEEDDGRPLARLAVDGGPIVHIGALPGQPAGLAGLGLTRATRRIWSTAWHVHGPSLRPAGRDGQSRTAPFPQVSAPELDVRVGAAPSPPGRSGMKSVSLPCPGAQCHRFDGGTVASSATSPILPLARASIRAGQDCREEASSFLPVRPAATFSVRWDPIRERGESIS
jgi:hypothetical protein